MTDPTDIPDDRERRLERAAARVAAWLKHLINPDQVVELRALRVQDSRNGSTWAGTFRGDEIEMMAREALKLSGLCQGVYYTLNPLAPHRMVAEAPRVRRRDLGELAKDSDVPARRWLLIDVDPVRAAGHEKASATDTEKAAAWETLGKMREYLSGRGASSPIVSDSGNGYHLLYRLEDLLPVATLPLPATDPIRCLLFRLAQQFDGPATIDTKVFNPARIVKFPGTLACKSESTPDRPHRRARILEIPELEGKT